MEISKNKKILIGILVVLVVVIGIWLALKSRSVSIHTDKTEYLKGDTLKVTIKNNLGENLCFSSCYPYYFGKKNIVAVWESYYYEACRKTDLIEKCMEPDSSKVFEISLFWIKEGPHRIAVPVCINCEIGDEFKESKRFYSNEFMVE